MTRPWVTAPRSVQFPPQTLRLTTAGLTPCSPPQLHGPYLQWTRKVNGKTVTRLLGAEQMERYREWFDTAKRLRALLAELEARSLEIAESTEHWR